MQDYLAKNKAVLKSKIRGFFCVQGNMKQPTGPKQVEELINNHLKDIITQGARRIVPLFFLHIVFLPDPEGPPLAHPPLFESATMLKSSALYHSGCLFSEKIQTC